MASEDAGVDRQLCVEPAVGCQCGRVAVDDDGRNITAGVQNAENNQPSIILAKIDAVIAEDAQTQPR